MNLNNDRNSDNIDDKVRNKENIKYSWKLDNSYMQLGDIFYTQLNPTAVSSPKLVLLNQALLNDLELDYNELSSSEGISILAGNKLADGSIPIAQAYAGHQFGYFNMLGDGRAILLGEQILSTGERYDIQLKGSGRTPYSRGGDGRAALGPMLREYLISEAMHGLGIETTRSLAVVTTGDAIYREGKLTGAILTRVASSHIRVATFQYASQYGSIDDVKSLADYTIERHYKECTNSENPYKSLLESIIDKQASLIAKWQLVGFIHGVMNTDNMAISGETIDYGPCAFMDVYDPKTVFSSIDTKGRYSYGNQPAIGSWNLARLAETLVPLLSSNQEDAIKYAEDALALYSERYHFYWLKGMRRKLGFFTEEENDLPLIKELLQVMYQSEADYTNTFLTLIHDKEYDSNLWKNEAFVTWKMKWRMRLEKEGKSSHEHITLMKSVNPALIPRNHLVEESLESAVTMKDMSRINQLLYDLSTPYEHSSEQEQYSILPTKSNESYKTYCGT